jgi:hypothetical protein
MKMNEERESPKVPEHLSFILITGALHEPDMYAASPMTTAAVTTIKVEKSSEDSASSAIPGTEDQTVLLGTLKQKVVGIQHYCGRVGN